MDTTLTNKLYGLHAAHRSTPEDVRRTVYLVNAVSDMPGEGKEDAVLSEVGAKLGGNPDALFYEEACRALLRGKAYTVLSPTERVIEESVDFWERLASAGAGSAVGAASAMFLLHPPAAVSAAIGTGVLSYYFPDMVDMISGSSDEKPRYGPFLPAAALFERAKEQHGGSEVSEGLWNLAAERFNFDLGYGLSETDLLSDLPDAVQQVYARAVQVAADKAQGKDIDQHLLGGEIAENLRFGIASLEKRLEGITNEQERRATILRTLGEIRGAGYLGNVLFSEVFDDPETGYKVQQLGNLAAQATSLATDFAGMGTVALGAGWVGVGMGLLSLTQKQGPDPFQAYVQEQLGEINRRLSFISEQLNLGFGQVIGYQEYTMDLIGELREDVHRYHERLDRKTRELLRRVRRNEREKIVQARRAFPRTTAGLLETIDREQILIKEGHGDIANFVRAMGDLRDYARAAPHDLTLTSALETGWDSETVSDKIGNVLAAQATLDNVVGVFPAVQKRALGNVDSLPIANPLVWSAIAGSWAGARSATVDMSTSALDQDLDSLIESGEIIKERIQGMADLEAFDLLKRAYLEVQQRILSHLSSEVYDPFMAEAGTPLYPAGVPNTAFKQVPAKVFRQKTPANGAPLLKRLAYFDELPSECFIAHGGGLGYKSYGPFFELEGGKLLARAESMGAIISREGKTEDFWLYDKQEMKDGEKARPACRRSIRHIRFPGIDTGSGPSKRSQVQLESYSLWGPFLETGFSPTAEIQRVIGRGQEDTLCLATNIRRLANPGSNAYKIKSTDQFVHVVCNEMRERHNQHRHRFIHGVERDGKIVGGVPEHVLATGKDFHEYRALALGMKVMAGVAAWRLGTSLRDATELLREDGLLLSSEDALKGHIQSNLIFAGDGRRKFEKDHVLVFEDEKQSKITVSDNAIGDATPVQIGRFFHETIKKATDRDLRDLRQLVEDASHIRGVPLVDETLAHLMSLRRAQEATS